MSPPLAAAAMLGAVSHRPASLRFKRTARLLGLVLVAAFAAGSDYRGCGSSPHPELPADGAELPEATGCLTDRDCVSTDMCVQLGCRAGLCEQVGGGPDGDGDGFEAAPCGDDCNDDDPNRFPGARETCDGVDEDCDGNLDEGAIGLGRLPVDSGLGRSQLVAVDGRLVVFGFGGDPSALVAAPVSSDGSVLDVIVTGVEAASFTLASRGSTAALVSVSEAGEIGLRDVSFEGPTLVVGAQTPLGSDEAIARPRVWHLAGQDWVAWDEPNEPAVRRLWRSGDGSTVDLMAPSEPRTASLADDGTHLAVTEGDFEVAFFSADGTRVATVAAPGPFADDPLASGDGLVYAAFRDAIDHGLVGVRFDGLGQAVLAPSGRRTDRVTLASVTMSGERRVVVTRDEGSTASASFFTDDLRMVVGSFPMGTLRATRQFDISGVSVVEAGGGPAIYLSGFPVSTLATIGCNL